MTAPIVIPDTKYFCIKGYTNTIGPVTITVSAIFNDSLGILIAVPTLPPVWDKTVLYASTLFTILYK